MLNLASESVESRSVKFLHGLLIIGLSLFACKHGLAIGIESKSSDLQVGCVEGNLSLLSVDLLLDKLLNVNAPSAAVNSLDFATLALVEPAHDLDSITLANWNGTHVVFCF